MEPKYTVYMESSEAVLFTLSSEIREAIISVAIEDISAPKGAQLLDRVSIRLIQLLDRWIHSMEGKQGAALVVALASAEIPQALADIWIWWLSIGMGLADEPRRAPGGRMAVTMSPLLFPVLKKSVEVMRRMGGAIRTVLGQKTAVADMRADAPERYRYRLTSRIAMTDL